MDDCHIFSSCLSDSPSYPPPEDLHADSCDPTYFAGFTGYRNCRALFASECLEYFPSLLSVPLSYPSPDHLRSRVCDPECSLQAQGIANVVGFQACRLVTHMRFFGICFAVRAHGLCLFVR